MHSKFSKSIVGPLPVQLFFESFANPETPRILSTMKRVLKKTFSRITSRSKSQDIEAELVHAVSTHGFCPQYDLQSHPISVEGKSTNTRPNLCLHSCEESSDPNWTNLELIVDVRDNESADPFPFPSADSTHQSPHIDEGASQQVLEDLERYFLAQFCRQHRTSTLAICIFGRFVRFLRVDHAGVSVSESTNYVSNPRVLAEFLWRYSHLSRIQRGFDPTVVPATSAERLLLTKAITHHVTSADLNVQADPKIRNTLAKDYPTYKIEVVDEFSSKRTEYIVRKPCAEPSHPLGRATRGFVALLLDSNDSDESPASLGRRLVFMKDYWRVPSTTLQKESESYNNLEEHDVPHIPTVFSAGDVFSGSQPQLSVTQRILRLKGVKLTNPPTSLSQFIHHRVVQQLGLPLDTLRNARDLVQVMRDALEALIDGYVKARILHRDISSNNILVSVSEDQDGRRRGMLNDWDISCKIPPGYTTVLPRSGTWRFMSCALLEEIGKSHEIYDDMQSIFWVMLFVAARHLKHTGKFNILIFDEEEDCTSLNGTLTTIGGIHKLSYLDRSKTKFECRALEDMFMQFRKFWLNYHYRDRITYEKIHDDTPLQGVASQLLQTFDAALCRPAQDWENGEWMDDQYPKWDGSQVRQSMLAITTEASFDRKSDGLPSSTSLSKQSDHTIADLSRPSSHTLAPPTHQAQSLTQKRKRMREDEPIVVQHHPNPNRKRPRMNHSHSTTPPLRRSQRLLNKRPRSS
ncbi:hypothetical protein K474DRAFT_1774461 [Panus rudis PR-1116 ss-1]|nr:hypothetical protein K474DRAFT_1774461 [Panus rudis PR-1116 ss-1]